MKSVNCLLNLKSLLDDLEARLDVLKGKEDGGVVGALELERGGGGGGGGGGLDGLSDRGSGGLDLLNLLLGGRGAASDRVEERPRGVATDAVDQHRPLEGGELSEKGHLF